MKYHEVPLNHLIQVCQRYNLYKSSNVELFWPNHNLFQVCQLFSSVAKVIMPSLHKAMWESKYTWWMANIQSWDWRNPIFLSPWNISDETWAEMRQLARGPTQLDSPHRTFKATFFHEQSTDQCFCHLSFFNRLGCTRVYWGVLGVVWCTWKWKKLKFVTSLRSLDNWYILHIYKIWVKREKVSKNCESFELKTDVGVFWWFWSLMNVARRVQSEGKGDEGRCGRCNRSTCTFNAIAALAPNV